QAARTIRNRRANRRLARLRIYHILAGAAASSGDVVAVNDRALVALVARLDGDIHFTLLPGDADSAADVRFGSLARAPGCKEGCDLASVGELVSSSLLVLGKRI